MGWLATAAIFIPSLIPSAMAGDPELPLDLGTAGDFVILSKSGISTVPSSSITGDMGVSPIAEAAITGFALIPDISDEFSTSSQVTGRIYAADSAVPTPAKMTTAISNMETAYGVAAGRAAPDDIGLGAGNISGLTIYPGLYKWNTSVWINSDVTLDALGNPDAIFIFQIAGDLTVASGQSVLLGGGAQASNIFWQVGGGTGAVVGTSAHMEGVILTATAITLQTGATVNGKLLAQTAVTLDKNIVMDSDLIPPQQLTLEIISAHGIGDWPVGIYTNDYGTVLTNAVTGSETLGGTQYVNTGWVLTGNDPALGTTNTVTLTQTNDAVLVWLWSTNYLLSISAPNGAVTNAMAGWKPSGDLLDLYPVPDQGYVFDHWEVNGNDVGSGVPLNVTMDGQHDVLAVFALQQLTLEITSEHGIGDLPAGIYTNAYGTILTNAVTGSETLGGTQYVNTGWVLTGNDPLLGTTNTVTLTQTNDAVLAWQWSTNYLLSISAPNGAVTNATAGWKPSGADYDLYPVSDQGYVFDHWEVNGIDLGSGVPLNVTMDGQQDVTAVFALQQLTLEIVSAHGIGDLPVGIYTNAYGTILTNAVTGSETLGGTQYVNTGWVLTGNDPALGTTNTVTLTQTNDAALAWQWSTNYQLSISSPNGAVTNATAGWKPSGDLLDLYPVPGQGYVFDHWEVNGINLGSGVPLNVTMDGEQDVVAVFALQQLTLEIVSAHGIGDWPVGIYTNAYGTILTNAVSGSETLGGTQYVNTGWVMTGNDPLLDTTNTVTLTQTNDAILVWLWDTNYLLSISSPNGAVTNATAGWKPSGDLLDLYPVPGQGYVFDHWEVNGIDQGSGSPLGITMDAEQDVVAVFALQQLTLEIVSAHGIGDLPVGIYTNAYGSILTNAVTGSETLGGTQYVNTGWVMTGNDPALGTTNRVSLTQTNDAILVWLWDTNYLLSISSPNGAVTNVTTGWKLSGADYDLYPVPDQGYVFDHWEVNGVDLGSGVPLNVTMDGQQDVTAVFALQQLMLEIVSDHGTGDLPTGIYTNAYGTILTNAVTGMETLGGTQYVNTGWVMTGNDPLLGTTNTVTLTQTNDAVLAWLWDTNFLLSISAPNGAVTNANAGWKPSGADYDLYPVPDQGYSFDHWEVNGINLGSGVPLNVTMDGQQDVTAVFAPTMLGDISWNVIWRFDPRKGFYIGTLTITNPTNSMFVLAAPFWLKVLSTEWHWLREPTGFDAVSGMHYVDLSQAIHRLLADVGNGNQNLEPGESVAVGGIELIGRRTPASLVLDLQYELNPSVVINIRLARHDFDGDGISDYGVYHAESGRWHWMLSISGLRTGLFGYAGTAPVTGDWDGDGRDDFGVYHTQSGRWYRMLSTDGFRMDSFGYAGTVPLSGAPLE